MFWEQILGSRLSHQWLGLDLWKSLDWNLALGIGVVSGLAHLGSHDLRLRTGQQGLLIGPHMHWRAVVTFNDWTGSI